MPAIPKFKTMKLLILDRRLWNKFIWFIKDIYSYWVKHQFNEMERFYRIH